ncbi:MAG: transcriptional regulator TrmB [Candidatus Kaiserbacteria bacterium]|nr:transcriptional regulator TrmB [Candidatus Kaiserbacteria bacterium]
MTNKKESGENFYLRSALKAGLSAKAAAVYVVMLEAGIPLNPKVIVMRTKLHRQYVYDALHEMQERRLVQVVGEGRKVKYHATSPDKLLQEAEKARMDAIDGVTHLMKLYDRSPAGIVEVIRGEYAVIADEFKLLQEARVGEFLDIVGGAGMNFVMLMGDRIHQWEDLRKQKEITLRYIGSGEDVRHNREESVITNESRLIPGIGNIVNIAIRPNSVSFNFYEPEVVTVRVRNEAAVVSQRALFEVLWNVAK